MAKECKTEVTARRQKSLEDSLLRLMRSRMYEEITVSDICHEANIPRRTFYHYFDSKDDVLDYVIEDLIRACDLESELDITTDIPSMEQSFLRFFYYWMNKENRWKLDLFVRRDLLNRVIAREVLMMDKDHKNYFAAIGKTPEMAKLEYMVAVTSFFSIMIYWSQNGYRETPEQMAAYTVRLLTEPTCRFD